MIFTANRVLMNYINFTLLTLMVGDLIGLIRGEAQHSENEKDRRSGGRPITLNRAAPIRLRVMTFNTWNGGNNIHRGHEKILAQIAAQRPDVILLQEARPQLLSFLKTNLPNRYSPESGPYSKTETGTGKQFKAPWYYCINYADRELKNVIISRHRIVQRHKLLHQKSAPLAVGCQVEIRHASSQQNNDQINFANSENSKNFRRRNFYNHTVKGFQMSLEPDIVTSKVLATKTYVNLWNLHLYWKLYGPYAACQRSLRDPYQLYLCERGGHQSSQGKTGKSWQSQGVNGRLQEIFTLLRHPDFWSNVIDAVSPLGTPLIVGGDFNAPSHLDWTPSARSLHCDWTYKWPVTALFESYGFKDSFRSRYPNATEMPGNTWSPIYKLKRDWESIYVPEPQDRIDFLHYKSDRITVHNSWVTEGEGRINVYPNHRYNAWPSDHAAVVTDFVIHPIN